MFDRTKPLDELLAEARRLAREGKILEAGKFLRSLANEYTESSEVQFLLGACYAKVGREDLARVSWRRSVELAPGNHRAKAWLYRLENKDPTNFEITDEGSGAISGDLDSCWDPTA